MIIVANIFNNNPFLAICLIVKTPEEKTIAFGGVPTGNIKAQLAAKVIGKQSCKILYSVSNAKSATTGIRTETKAMLDMISVPKIAIPTKINNNTKIPTFE